MTNRYISAAIMAALAVSGASASRIVHLPMEPVSRDILRETVGGKNIILYSKFVPETPAGAAGAALRFDGFSSYAQGNIEAGSPEASQLTFAMWVAPETYPVIALDTPVTDRICMAGTLDESAHKGWRFSLGYTGKYAFECFSGGWKVVVEAEDILPTYEWSHLVAVADGTTKNVTLYRNGVRVGQGKCMATIDNSATRLTVGKEPATAMCGPFNINTFNGLIDDIEVFDNALAETEIRAYAPENAADLTVPSTRYAEQKLRPRFHGMPATAWTNESHGLIWSGGRWHVFFQKNANGPYMTRLHWGHISSPDLLNWREERIAIAPGESYDIKGCWSGAVFTDPVLTEGNPAAIYTAVDYAKATICMASPADDDLVKWSKKTDNPVINGRPSGLSDDFRDPYFFRNGDDAYIIVGTSKEGRGAATLHKLNPATGTFSNDGRIFFSSTNAAAQGTFWEMPNVTPLGDGRWLFTATPLGIDGGVRTLYWTGAIASDGTFSAQTEPRTVELESRDGYGLLSPSIVKKDGKILALGIVPDKLPGEDNYQLGWAHCYSLPREWSVDAAGNLIQRPYAGVSALRDGNGFSAAEQTLAGDLRLDGISGRRVEVKASFTVGTTPFGIRFLNDGRLYYNPATGELVADFSALPRKSNDGHLYKGIYRMALPERPAQGSEMQIDFFIDGSIMDIFVNDRYAQSIRLFANDEVEETYAVYAEGPVTLKSLNAWNLNAGNSGIGSVEKDDAVKADLNVYDLNGRRVGRVASAAESLEGLDSGVYVVGGRKIRIDR